MRLRIGKEVKKPLHSAATRPARPVARVYPPGKTPGLPRDEKPEVRIFVSYSHADEAVRAKLDVHLANLKRNAVSTWFDGDMIAGDAISRDIGRALRNAHVFVALVSSDYLHSRYCQLEYRRAMNRQARGLMRVVAVIVRPCDWKAAPIAAFKLLPHDGRSVAEHGSADRALVGVVQALREVVKLTRAELVATPRRRSRAMALKPKSRGVTEKRQPRTSATNAKPAVGRTVKAVPGRPAPGAG